MNESTDQKITREYENDPSIMAMYSFYDKRDKSYDTPFFCKNDLFAKRHFHMSIAKSGVLLHTFKEDFELHRIGYFNTSTSEFVPFESLVIEGKQIDINNKE